MSSRGVQKRIITKDIVKAFEKTLIEGGYKPEDFKPKEEDKLPMPVVTTLQGPWKIMYSQEGATGRAILVQLDFDKPAYRSDYDFDVYWKDVDTNVEQRVLPAHSDKNHTKWMEDPLGEVGGRTHLIWFSGGIQAPGRVGKFKLMLIIVPKGCLDDRSLKASEFALRPLIAGIYQQGEEKDYVEVLDHDEYPTTEQQLQRTRAGGPEHPDLWAHWNWLRQVSRNMGRDADAVSDPITVPDPNTVPGPDAV